MIEELIPPLSHKQPKIIAATLSALTTIYHAYGCKTADPKPVLKALPKVFGHADKNVRAEAQNLAVELYRWLREAMKVFWNDLKPVQQQDLEALFDKVKQDPSPKQERLLRSQREVPAHSPGGEDGDAAAGGEEVDEEPEGINAYDLAEPVNVTSKISSDLYENLASTKWKVRKESLEALYEVINIPRIKDADFGELVRALAKCMKDTNIAVVTTAANCVEALANGTRASFGKYRSIILNPMMERLKEKKQSVADALGAAMDAVFISTSLSDCLEDTLEYMTHKNPQVKLESVRFLIRCLRNTREVPTKAEVKLISDAATKLLTESTENLRSSGAEILGTVMKIMGERAMNPYMEGLDEIRRSKVKEFYEKAEVKAKDKPKPAAPPPLAAAPASKGTKTPAGKKVPEKKPSGGLAKGTSNPASATEEVKATGRSIPSKLGGPKPTATGASSGLKLQRKPAGPGGLASAAASPVKPPVSHTAPAAPEETASAPKLGLAGRGLAGRPLGRPTPVPHPTETPGPAGSAMKAQERAELEELRAENERLKRNDEELRSERSRLMSEIHELQNQNAQLIEDHTRNMLSLKAKETQLVRARSDAEAAEQTCQKQQREMERLKRELSSTIRSASPGPTDLSEQIYRDTGLNGMAPPPYGANHGKPLMSKKPTYGSNFGEEKENGGPLDGVDLRGGTKMTSPTLSSAVSSETGRSSPTVGGGSIGGGGVSGNTNNGEGIESWKRAAEVTSQLKARIEQMKVRLQANCPEILMIPSR